MANFSRSILNAFNIILSFYRRLIIRNSERPKKLLLIETMGIGDVVCHTPFLKTIKESNKYDIYGCFPRNMIEMQKQFCTLDGYIEFDSFFNTIRKIRRSDIDCVVLNARAIRYASLALLSGKRISGYLNDYSFKFNYLNDYRIEFIGYKQKSHLIQYSKLHLTQRGNPFLEFLELKTISLPAIEDFEPNNSNYVVIHAGADYPGRQWPIENFRVVVKMLLDNYKESIQKVYLLGGKQDIAINEKISQDIKNCINLAGKLSLLETADLIKGARYFIGNDSGPLHMASLLDIPVLGFYGPNLPQISGPYSSKRKVFFHKFDCSPCNQKVCYNNFKCIVSISIEEVTKYLEQLES